MIRSSFKEKIILGISPGFSGKSFHMLSKSNSRLLLCFLIIVLISLPLFVHLGWQPIRIWDEARLSINAMEMHKNGNFLVTHYKDQPEMWNTKPPLMIWMQVAFIKLLGVTELSVRLPSAVAALATCLLLIGFSYKAFKQYWIGVLAALVLVTTNGYVHEHVSRTGDYDALLTFFTTAYCLSMFLYLRKGERLYFHLFFVALTLAFLTKSVQALIFLPAVALYVLYQKKLLSMLRDKWFYINTFIFLFFALGYHLLREQYNPGYIQAVWDNDFGGRFVNDLVEGNRDSWYYVVNIISHDFTYWLLFAIAGVVSGFKSKNSLVRAFTPYGLLLIVFYLLVISTAETRLPWYAAPLFPLLSVFAAIGLYAAIKLVQSRFKTFSRPRLLPYIFLAVVFIYPYQHIFRKTFRPTEEEWDKELYPISYILQKADRAQYSLDNYYVCHEYYSDQILFYIRTLNEKGQKISYRSVEQIAPGDTIIADEHPVRQRIEEKFDFEVLYAYYNVRIYKILSPKQEASLPPNSSALLQRNL